MRRSARARYGRLEPAEPHSPGFELAPIGRSAGTRLAVVQFRRTKCTVHRKRRQDYPWKTVLRIVRDGKTSCPVTVHWKTEGGTALSGEHYSAAQGRVVFASGERRKEVTVCVFPAHLDEDDPLDFYVTLHDISEMAELGVRSRVQVSLQPVSKCSECSRTALACSAFEPLVILCTCYLLFGSNLADIYCYGDRDSYSVLQ
jgi:hypothetical protein